MYSRDALQTMLTPKPFIFLRHGATDWLREHRVQGQSDVPLNEEGVDQARHAAERLRGAAIATVCCSPLQRARRTADIVNEVLRRPLVMIDGLRECDLGEMEGKTWQPLPPHWLKAQPAPGGESYDAFIARALDGINLALAHPGPVLIVSHGGVYWAVQIHAGLDKSQNIPNCTPVRHQPPADGDAAWRTSVIE
jgi:probable phosphoglycerate mutase